MTEIEPEHFIAHPYNEYHAIIEPTDTGSNLCTIYSTASEDPLVTTWISAEEGSYRSLANTR